MISYNLVPDEELTRLLETAYAYVYPSWYEGLGISALEALSAGAPLIASNIPALHEVAADAAKYFDPRSPDELRQCLTELADDAKERDLFAQKAKERAKVFSWTKTAELTWDALRSL